MWLLAGCSSHREADKPAADTSAATDADWSARKLITTNGKIGDIAFTIDLPSGMEQDKTGDPAVNMSWKAADKDYSDKPGVSVSHDSIPPKTLDEAITDAMPDKNDVVSRKEAIDGGFIVTRHTASKGLIYVDVYRTKGDKSLSAGCSQAKNGGLPNFDATKTWLENVCLSVRIQ